MAIPPVIFAYADSTGYCEESVGEEEACDSSTNPDVCMCTLGVVLQGFKCLADDCDEGECVYGGIKVYCYF